MVDEFQSADAGGDGGAPQVALLSITAAGVGIELFSAHTVVFAELYWTCGALVQAEDRCHRIGQTHDVTIHYLLAENTADEQIWFILRRKMDIVGQMLGTDEARLDADQVSYDGEIHETDMREFINALCDRGPLDSLDASTDGTCADQVVVPADQSTLDSFFQRSTPKKAVKAPKRRRVQVTLPNWEPKKFDVASPEAPEPLDVPETRPVATTLTSVATPASEAQQATQTPSLLKVKMPDPSKYMIY
jgi:hypothetical protein